MTLYNKIAQNRQDNSLLATSQQGKASDPRLSVWVEASAGTGKTKVLSDRVLRLLLEGTNPSRILCLTYTKAAAVEMNARISARLAKWAVVGEEELEPELQKLLGDSISAEKKARARTLFATLLDVPGGIKIQTIHSFCQEVLKRFPLEAGISPYFSVMDDQLAAEALKQVIRDLIAKIEQEPETPAACAVAYLTHHIREFKFPELMKTLADNRTRLLHSLSVNGGLDGFMSALRRKLGIKDGQTPESILWQFFAGFDRVLLTAIAQALEASSPTDVKKAQIIKTALSADETNFDYEAYKSVFLTKAGTMVAKPACKEAVKILPEIIPEMQKEACRLTDVEEQLQKLELYHSTGAVMGIAAELIRGYNKFKQKTARLDYEDLIVLTRRLLESPGAAQWVLYKLDGGISHVLIDEAQDTSPDQWAVIKAVTDEFFAGRGQIEGERTIFAVGDRKQSIYSFQGADPSEFDRMNNYFTGKIKNFANIRLDVSFRSTAAVLETVNHLFSQPEAQSGVVMPGQTMRHIPFRLGEGGKVELWPLEEVDEENADDVWYPPLERRVKKSAASLLARKIAQNIKTMVTGGEKLVSQNRPLRYRDFMVLVQRRNSFIEDLVRECKNLGVNITGVDKLKLTDQIAVEDMLSLARFLLLPADDLSLAEVLKSPLFELTDDDLFKLCHGRGPASLWSRLKDHNDYRQCAQILTRLLSHSGYWRPFELFNYVMTTLEGRRKFVARLGGEAEDALDELINAAINYEREHIPDLQGFLQWLSAGEAEVKRELEQTETDAVRVMTVHGSKGLQAPIVILPDTTRVANVRKSANILFDDDHLVYYPLSADNYDQVCEEIHEAEKSKAFDEYRRLLYVALTRAEDRLYICGYKSKRDISHESWYHLCREAMPGFATEKQDEFIYECLQQIEYPPADEAQNPAPAPATEPPLWLRQVAKPESPLARPYTPSHPEDEDDQPAASPLTESGAYYRRGLIIHKLLQFLPPALPVPEKLSLTAEFLQKNAPELSAIACNQIRQEIGRLFENPDFAFIFGPDSRAEVPVMGEVNGRIISAQIDRLVVTPQKVIIIDFKTNRPPAASAAETPEVYIKQLSVYKQLIEKIYPSRQVETFILWTNNGNLMQIN